MNSVGITVIRIDDIDVKRKMSMVLEQIKSKMDLSVDKPSPPPAVAPLQRRGIHIFPFTIAFADTDAGGIVYHARYIEIAERARMNWLKTFEPAPTDIGFAVIELSAKYKKPLRIADDFIVETSTKNIGTVSLTVEQKFVKNNEAYAILVIKVACLTVDLKPKRIPVEWHKYFN